MALDGVEHGVEAVGAGEGEVIGEAYFADEVRFGVDDLLRAATRIDLNEQGDQAGDDSGIAVGADSDLVAAAFQVQPDP